METATLFKHTDNVGLSAAMLFLNQFAVKTVLETIPNDVILKKVREKRRG